MKRKTKTLDQTLATHLGSLTEGLMLMRDSINFLKEIKKKPSSDVITGIQDVLYMCHELLDDFGISTELSEYLIDDVVEEKLEKWTDHELN